MGPQRDPEVEDPAGDDLNAVGTVAMVMRILRLPDGRVKVLVQGLCKASIDSFVESEPARWASVTRLPADDDAEWCVEAEALMRAVRGRVEELLPLKNLPPEVLSITANVHEAGRLADLIASNLKLRPAEAQELVRDLRDARVDNVDAPVHAWMKVLFKERSWGEMAASETYAHLEHLRRAGDAAVSADGPQLLYEILD